MLPADISPDGLVRAPCPGCGAQLRFSAEKQQMLCDHCGATEAIAFTQQNLKENPLRFRFDDGRLPDAPTEEKRLLCCESCGARTTVNYDAPTITCAFCGSRKVNPEAQKTRLIEPAGVLPFQLGRAQAGERFRDWIGSRWFAPNDLKAGAMLDNFHGLYIPFWTFDAHAQSQWAGEAGTYYHVPVQTRDANGRTVTQQERRVRWQFRSGTHAHFYDDHLEMASRNLAAAEADVRAVASYELAKTVDYDARVLLGWEAEVYTLDLPECAAKAEHHIRERETEACAQLLGGDTQRGLQVDTTLRDQTFKHLLLPLWICTYFYNGKLYRVLINGQTGRIAGKHPLSAWKIFFLVVFILIALAVGAVFFGKAPRH